MLGRHLLGVVMCVFIISAQHAEVFGQNLGAPIRKNKVRVYPPSAPPDLALKIDYDKEKTPPARQQLFQNVQDRLNKERIGVPADRLTFFRTVISPQSISVSGWRGIIDSVTPTKFGAIVDIRVHAFQPGMIDNAYFLERYSISDGKINYFGATVPPPFPRAQIGY